MAILFLESFDKYATGGTEDEILHFWSFAAADVQCNTGGRHGNEMEFTSNGSMISRTFSPGNSTGVLGFAYKVDALRDVDFVHIRENTTVHLSLKLLLSGGLIEIYRGTSTLLATSSSGLTGGDWYYIEFKWTIHDSTGAYELRINGTNVASASGVDTQNGGTAAWNNFRFEGLPNSIDSHFDDLYLLDGVSSGVTGAPANDFLGDSIVETIVPDGNGTTSQLVGQDADSTDNYQNVDEAPGMDEDTTYNQSATASDQDTYSMSNLSDITEDDIQGIMVWSINKIATAGTRGMKNIIRHGGTDYYGAEVIQGTDYSGQFDVAGGANPFSGSTQWTIANINALEAGVEISS